MSVCPSVTPRYSVETPKHRPIFKLFPPSGSHIILVFPHQTAWQYSDGDHHNGASSATENEKSLIFEINKLYLGTDTSERLWGPVGVTIRGRLACGMF